MLTDQGFEIKRLQEIITDLEDGQKVIFPGITLDPSSPDSQLTGLFAEQISINHETSLQIYNGIDPLTATGIALDRTVNLNGITRLKSAPTTVLVTFSGADGTIVPIDTEVTASTQPDIIFKTTAPGTVVAGTVDINAQSDTDGDYYIAIAAIDGIPTVITGITAVTNTAEGITGRYAETDSQLRARRNKALGVLSTSLIDSVRSEILTVTGITDAVVYENNTAITDGNGLIPHSMYAVVLGGGDDDIAAAIMEKKSIGCDMNGTTTVPWLDASGFSHDVIFERAATLDIFIEVIIVTPAGTVTAGMKAQIQTLIIDYIDDVKKGENACYQGQFGIGNDVPASLIYPALLNSTDFTVNNITVGIAVSPTGQIVTVPFDEVSNFLAANIEVLHL